MAFLVNARLRAAATAILLLGLPALGLLLQPTPAEARGQLQTYMTGLNWPIALAFSPDGRILYAERNTGSIRVIDGGMLLATPFYTLAGTATAGERGLLGLALDPGFPTSPWVYAYQTYNDVVNGTVYNRIVRITATGIVGLSHIVILRMPPLSGATNHNGGVIAFGPDGMLYAVVGENANIALAQDLTSPMGKVLRMNPDGTAPADNPFYGSPTANNLIYTYGHRNMFGLAFHPATGRAYVTENGPGCNDEVNLLESGRNFGWGPTQTCATPPAPPTNTNRDGPSPVLPIWWWSGTICPTNAAIYGGPYFPAWQGDLFMGDCNFRRLHRLHLVPPAYDTVASDDILLTAPNVILDVEAGPDGAIWLTTPTTIYRYVDVSVRPTASFTASPNPVDVGAPVAFDASASTDPDGTIVSYAWDFGDASTGTGVTASHAYAAPGTYRVVLTVVDNESYAGNATTDVVVRSPRVPQPPVASFTATPARVNPGDPVAFDASASYDPDGFIAWYAWDFGDGTNATSILPSAGHAYGAPGLYTATLTVTDNESYASSATRSVRVNAPPNARLAVSPPIAYIGVAVTFDASGSSDPDGDPLTYAWDFGDSATGAGVLVTHTYGAKGRFAVTLIVTDDLGASGTGSSAAFVGNRAPVITATDPSGPTLPLAPGEARTISVIATDPDGDVLTYEWRVNGAVVGGNASSVAFNESAVGTYLVSVTVTDGTLVDSASWAVAVTAGTGPPPGPSGLPVDPWWAAGLVLLAALAVAILVVVWRRRRKEPAAPPPPPP